MEILIDSEIRNWVFIPIIIVLILFSIIRMNIQRIMGGSSLATNVKKNDSSYNSHLESIKLAKAKKFYSNCSVLPPSSFNNRKTLFCQEKGFLHMESKQENQDMASMMAQNPMTNPDMMSKMMGSNMMMMVMFPLQMFGINYFFSGMIVGKVAFPLTQKFRELLQRGISIDNIDVKYISSLSLYFLVFMGIDKIFKIFLREDRKVNLQSMPMTATPPPNPLAGGSQGIKKHYDSERDNIKMMEYKFAFAEIESDFIEAN